MRTYGQSSGQLFPKKWPLSNQNQTKSKMNKHKMKCHRNSDSKTGNRDHIRITALERLVMNNCGLKLVLRRQPSVTNVVQTFSLLFGSHDNPPTRQRIFTVNK